MAISLIERINTTGRKTASINNWYEPLLLKSLARENIDLDDTRYSYALAYLYVEPIRVSVDKYSQTAGRVPYNLFQDDKSIGSSSDIVPRHPFMKMLRNHRKQFHVGFFPAVLYEQLLYDELYIEYLHPSKDATRLIPRDIVNGLRVLRGVAVSPQFQDGELQNVFHSADDDFGIVDASDIAYDKGYNPISDYYGASRIQSVLDETNILNRLRRFLMRFLHKADRPDVYASAKETLRDADAWGLTKKAFQDYKNDETQTMLAGTLPMDFTTIPRPDANNQLEIDDKTRNAIYRAFGINPALAGDTSSTSFKEEHAAIFSSWIKTDVLFYLEQIDEVINDVMLPRLFPDEKGLRLEHDVSEFDIVTSEDKTKIDAADQVLRSSAITFSQYVERIGEKPEDVPKELIDCVMIEGIPVPLENVRDLWRYKFAAPATEQFAQAQLSKEQADNFEEPSPETKDFTSDILADTRPIATEAKAQGLTVKAFNPSQATPDDELSAWRKVALKSKGKRNFECEWLRGDIADRLIPEIKAAKGSQELIAKAFESAQGQLDKNFKSIQSTRLDFEGDYDNILTKGRASNNFNRSQWASSMRRIIKQYGRLAYIDGLNEGGVLGDDIESEDQAEINTINREQSQHVTNLGQQLFKTTEGISDALAEQKAAMWFNGSIMPFYQAGKLSSSANKMMEWALGNTEKHCKSENSLIADCPRLDGQRHRFKDWMRIIGGAGVVGQKTVCEGWKCECKLFEVSARARGAY